MFAGLTTKLIIAGIVLAVLGGAWLYYQGLLDQITTLEVNQAQLETAVDLKQAEIASLEAQAASATARVEVVQAEFAEARAQSERLKRLFANHDFDRLAKAKPGLISRKMQRATEKVWREIEEIGND